MSRLIAGFCVIFMSLSLMIPAVSAAYLSPKEQATIRTLIRRKPILNRIELLETVLDRIDTKLVPLQQIPNPDTSTRRIIGLLSDIRTIVVTELGTAQARFDGLSFDAMYQLLFPEASAVESNE